MLQHLHETSALRLCKRIRHAVTFRVDLDLPEKPHGKTFTEGMLGNIKFNCPDSLKVRLWLMRKRAKCEIDFVFLVSLFVLIVNRSQMLINFLQSMTWLWQNNTKPAFNLDSSSQTNHDVPTETYEIVINVTLRPLLEWKSMCSFSQRFLFYSSWELELYVVFHLSIRLVLDVSP